MKCLHISDTHNKHRSIKWPVDLSEIDCIIHSGDFSGVGEKHVSRDFFEWMVKLPVKYKIIVAGNHDKSFDKKYWKEGFLDKADRYPVDVHAKNWVPKLIRNFKSMPGQYYLLDEAVTIEGINFYGSPYSNWFHGQFWAFNVNPGDEAIKLYAKIPKDTDVLITHGPAMGKLDYIPTQGFYAGSDELLQRIKKIKPKYHLTGHIHEGYGETWDGDTTYLNSSLMDLNYDLMNEPQIFEVFK